MSSDPASLFLPEPEIRSLVPARLPRRRSERYGGGAVHGRIARDFGDDEADTLRTLYAEMGELMDLTKNRDASEGADSTLGAALKEFAGRTSILRIGTELEKFERSARATHDTRLANLFREIADGPFASLYGILFLIGSAGVEPEYFQTLFYLARDQRKIMRSILADLDPAAREQDELEKHHSVDLLLEKWRDAVYRAFDAELEVDFETRFEGPVAERCVEFAEVDRLFYHLANNAIRHGAENRLAIQVIESPDGADLIWLFSNPVSENREATLRNLAEGKNNVFEYGVGSGSGVGLGSLAESVAHAYGIESPAQAVSGGYVGATSGNGVFRLWFHWPKVT
jgi:hypothetical protein